ncbi:GNAT family N-acetyltransferase [Rhodococcus opacus]|uniref:GNAT family N-acetyltransferase n=1 Tax=Rhodococcus opacus TaxID=37919 RepID=UPI0007CD4317|nr:GNAT family N-acetyltransferase [Rhodococcus opacus]MDX5962438.1 GNAT family N-acetyltransferase [Rhodococcus opacus]CAG7639759.1 hypothetical protein E143388_08120 [Rhodococcus opacus]
MTGTTVTPAAVVRIRRLNAEDRDAVQRLHQRLNEHDTYLRFFALRPTHLRELATALCLQDAGHCALGAFIGGSLVGVANYIALAQVAGTAPVEVEFAIVVDHDHQLHGIGTMLLTRLVEEARQHGIVHLTAEMLTQNARVLRLIREQGWSGGLRRDGSQIHLDLHLNGDPDIADGERHRTPPEGIHLPHRP